MGKNPPKITAKKTTERNDNVKITKQKGQRATHAKKNPKTAQT